MQMDKETPGASQGASWVETKLAVLSEMARQNPQCKFTSLAYLLKEGFLTQCYWELRRDAAPGVDRQSWEEYGANLQENIAELVQRMKATQYRPKPVRRVWIPKDEKNQRPLGIPAVEDKIVQMGMTKILEAIYAHDFLPVSYGFRAGKGCHDALKALDDGLMTRPVNYVVDADIKGFFDSVDHQKLVACLKQRIADPRFLQLVVRVLKAGVVEEEEYRETEVGTPQGGILSPILSNIFLHYVLDQWFETKLKPQLGGHAALFRYADDFVVSAQYRDEAEWILAAIRERFTVCGLTLSTEKTRLVSFGRYAEERAAKRGEKAGSFNFLGFLHYCAKTRNGKFRVGRQTSPKKFRAKAKAMEQWLRTTANRERMREWWPKLQAKLEGHYEYYGVSGNAGGIRAFRDTVVRQVHKWLNRRSQRKSHNWERLRKYMEHYPLPKATIRHRWWEPRLALGA